MALVEVQDVRKVYRRDTQEVPVLDGKVSSRTVDVGPARGNQVEIRRGLEGGEQVVLEAPAGLKDGARVRVKGSG